MRVAAMAVAFVVGIVIGGAALYVVQKDTIEELCEKKSGLEASEAALEQKFEDVKCESELLHNKIELLQEEIDELTEQLKAKDGELKEAKAENERLKGIVSEKIPAKSSKQVEEPEKPEAKPEEAKEAELIGQLKDLLSRIELAPADRKLMRELSDKIWHLEDEAALKEIVDKLQEIFADALADDPENLDLLFNQGNAYGAELAYLQIKMKESPMVYGPKMGEVAIKVINCFNKVIEKDPKDNVALLSRGSWCYHMPGQIKQAEKDFTELVKRAKEQGFGQEMGEQVFSGMAMTYSKAGRTQEAKKSAQEGLRLYPQSEQLRKLLDELQKQP